MGRGKLLSVHATLRLFYRYAIRPCQGATTWGGINTTLCNAPTQDISFILGG
jgi:hypothetical protein